MKNINWVYCWLMLLIVTGCSKFLDEKSNKSLVVLNKLADMQALLDNSLIMNLQTPGFGLASDDDYFVTNAAYNAFDNLSRLSYIWKNDEYGFSNDWAKNYNIVYHANYVLETLSEVSMTTSNEIEWKSIKGAAYFFRGYSFLNLCWIFALAYDTETAAADKGIVLRLGADFNVPSQRASVRASYQQVIDDLMQAVQYLPENTLHPMRPNLAAGYGALARAYLSMRQYDSAYHYADKALQLKSDLLDYNQHLSAPVQAPFGEINKEVIFYSEFSATYSSILASNCLIDTSLLATYHSEDLRKDLFFIGNGTYNSFRGWYSGVRNKFFSGIATDELYLTRIECLVRLNKGEEALKDLNILLKSRWKSGKYEEIKEQNKAVLLTLVLQERRKTLLMRGLRWIDIKRLNKEGRNIIPTRIIDGIAVRLEPNAKEYALPIPRVILEITGIAPN